MLRANQAVRMGLRAASRNPELAFGKALIDQAGNLIALLPLVLGGLLIALAVSWGGLPGALRALRLLQWPVLGGILTALIVSGRWSGLCFIGHCAFPAFFVLLEGSADFLAGFAAAVFVAELFAGRAFSLFCAVLSVPLLDPLVPFSSCARKYVFTRARSLRASRKRFNASACPVES